MGHTTLRWGPHFPATSWERLGPSGVGFVALFGFWFVALIEAFHIGLVLLFDRSTPLFPCRSTGEGVRGRSCRSAAPVIVVRNLLVR